MPRKQNLNVSTSLNRCPRCGGPVKGDGYHWAPVDPTWTAAQMHNDPDKMYLCREN